MASGYRSGREVFGLSPGSAVQVPFPASQAGAKRSLTEMERQQHQLQLQLQHALFLRSVKQRTHLASPVSPLSPVDLLSSSPSSLLTPPPSSLSTSSVSSAFGFQRRPESSSPAAAPVLAPAAVVWEPGSKLTAPNSMMNNRLEELERRLLDDDDDDEVTVTGVSALTATTTAAMATEWGEAMRQLISTPAAAAVHSPQQPAVTAAAPGSIPLSPSPTNSSSSTVSSSASCSPPSPAPSSRQMLLDTAAAVADGNLEVATANLAVLKRAANPRGDAEQRLTAVMVAALLCRLNPPKQQQQIENSALNPVAELCSAEHFAATQMLYDISPCFKLGLFAANYAILEATKDQPKIHIIDFEVGQGGQYAALLHALLERHRRCPAVRPPAVKITAVADPTSPFSNSNNSAAGGLRAVGDRIEKLAERNGLAVKFNIVARRVTELDAAALGCEPGEAVAVNLAFVLSRVADESVSLANPRDELLRRLRALQPCVVALVEQEINTNTAAFVGRFTEACGHYGALLESLDATAPRDNAERARVEAGLVRKVVNSVAREGMDRVERCEVFGKWRARMGMAGFQPVQLGPAVSEPVKARLVSSARNPGFSVNEVAGIGLGFGWMGRVLTVASAWR